MVHRIESLCAEIDRLHPDAAEWRSGGTPAVEIDRMLLERGSISENDLLALYAEFCPHPVQDEEELATPERFNGVSEEYLRRQLLLPVAWDDHRLEVYAAFPYDLERQAYELEQFFGRRVEFRLLRPSVIERMQERLFRQSETDADNPAAGTPGDEHHLRRLAGDARIVRLVNEMLTQALEQAASDIHVEPEEHALAIRFRVDGVLRDYLQLPAQDYPAIASRIKLIGALNIAESRLPQDGRTNFRVGRLDIDIRISTIPVMNGESIVMRLLRKDAMRFDLRELGMGDAMRRQLEQLIAIPHGIILVVGPTGSGKTTTLYSVMQQLNDRKRKIITIEDPVEYKLPGLNQMQVNPKIGLTFAGGLRHIVRQDPDVILIGEIRDHETADIAINAALTGHLVLSTLHTNDAVGAITRLADMGMESFLVASSLVGVLSQRLVRQLCPRCGGSGRCDSGRCRHCGGSGYRGRTGIYELLTVNEPLRTAIVGRKPASELNAVAIHGGMVPLLDDGRRKVREGVTSPEEVLRIASGVAN